MKCQYCHNDNRDDAKFCNSCGTRMSPAQALDDEIFCPECGQKIKRKAVICVKCGCQVKEIEEKNSRGNINQHSRENNSVSRQSEFWSKFPVSHIIVLIILSLFLAGVMDDMYWRFYFTNKFQRDYGMSHSDSSEMSDFMRRELVDKHNLINADILFVYTPAMFSFCLLTSYNFDALWLRIILCIVAWIAGSIIYVLPHLLFFSKSPGLAMFMMTITIIATGFVIFKFFKRSPKEQ